MKTNFFYRLTCLLGFLAVLVALGSAYYMQHFMYLEPCPMCMLQRVVFMVMGVFFLLMWLLVPSTFGRRLGAVLLLGLSVAGTLLAYRHLEIINAPPGALAAGCDALNIAQESDFWQKFFMQPVTVVEHALAGGSGCGKKEFFFGLLIPGWALIAYAGLASLALVGATPRAPRRWFAT